NVKWFTYIARNYWVFYFTFNLAVLLVVRPAFCTSSENMQGRIPNETSTTHCFHPGNGTRDASRGAAKGGNSSAAALPHDSGGAPDHSFRGRGERTEIAAPRGHEACSGQCGWPQHVPHGASCRTRSVHFQLSLDQCRRI